MTRKHLDQVVYEYVVNRIENGSLLEREHITEQHVANILEISRTPVRKAFNRLVSERYLEDIPNVGVRVRQREITSQDFKHRLDLFERLVNFYLFDLEKKEITFDVIQLNNYVEQLKNSKDKAQSDFTKAELDYWNEILKYNENSYSKKILLKTLRECLCVDGQIEAILTKSRSLIIEHLQELAGYLNDGNYPHARREIRILLNQIKLNVIELG